MTANELRQKYLEFFESKGHKIIPSASVVPENDPTVLFTTAGMHPLVPYLMGEKHPMGQRLTDSQKCIRTVDIDNVGDNRHLTFFEMLGNWSLGSYFKEDAISWSFEFMTEKKWLGLDPKRIYTTVFSGDEKSDVVRDDESIALWKEQFKKVGIEAGVCELNGEAQKDSRIFLLGREDNFWGPAGETGPCGPCSEIFYDTRPEEGELSGTHEELVKSFRLMEIWNDVFMEFEKTKDGKFEKMAQKNVDTGMGLERTITVLSGKENVFDTDLFLPIIKKIEELSGKSYQNEENKKPMRIISDHLKAAVFIIADGVEPSNKGRGYILRRLIRRAVVFVGVDFDSKKFKLVTQEIFDMYKDAYPEFNQEDKRADIWGKLSEEIRKFRATIENGLKEFEKGEDPFILFTTYGFPIEITKELAKEKGIKIDEDDFNRKLKQHQDLSRTASAGMFKGGLSDAGEIATKYHTSTHLLLAAIREILGSEIYQKGSNINSERLRFDFNYPEKLTPEQIKKIEDRVNEKIKENIPVEMTEMKKDEALKLAKVSFDPAKYGDVVKVYKIGDFSTELCGGPHVKNTGEIGHFKIKKEESSSSGIRRIKAVIE